jgi:hypothetical protein
MGTLNTSGGSLSNLVLVHTVVLGFFFFNYLDFFLFSPQSSSFREAAKALEYLLFCLTVLCLILFSRCKNIVHQEAMEKSVAETENGDAFLELKKLPTSKSPHRYTKVSFVSHEVIMCSYFIGII